MLDNRDLKTALNYVMKARLTAEHGPDAARYILFDFTVPGRLTIVATDNARLHYVTLPYRGPARSTMLLNPDHVSQLARGILLSGSVVDLAGHTFTQTYRGKVRTWECEELSSNYPNWRKLLPSSDRIEERVCLAPAAVYMLARVFAPYGAVRLSTERHGTTPARVHAHSMTFDKEPSRTFERGNSWDLWWLQQQFHAELHLDTVDAAADNVEFQCNPQFLVDALWGDHPLEIFVAPDNYAPIVIAHHIDSNIQAGALVMPIARR